MDKFKKLKVILGTESKNKIKIFSQLKIPFKTIISNFEENLNKEDYSVEDYVKYTAYHKYLSICKDIKEDWDIIITLDVVMHYNNKIYEKPENINQARDFLRDFNNNIINCYNHIWIIYKNNKNEIKESDFGVNSKIKIANLTEEMIHDFPIDFPLCLKGSGGILLQKCYYLVEEIQGSYSNILGLPLKEVSENLLAIIKE